MKKDMNNILNIIFLFCFFEILFVGFLTIIMPPKEKSELENRPLEKFEVLNIKNFLQGTFQTKLEDALADQVMFSRNIKYYSNKYLNIVNYRKLNKSICKNKYVQVKNDNFTFDCDDRIIEGPADVDNYKHVMQNHLKYLNSINSEKVYYYVVDRAYGYDFENNEMAIDTLNIAKKNISIPNGHIKRLNVKNYRDYQKYFYKSDHHWNYLGSYQGYKDIISMLNPTDEVLKPIGIKQIDSKFYGSASKNTGVYDIYDSFQFYKFNYDDFKVYINGKESCYGKYDEVLTNKTSHLNYYGEVYGYDLPEILFDFNNTNKDNLMIIATSYSNPINVMLASHYNKTYVYDLRHYRNFDFNQVVNDNKIDKVLILLSTDMLVNEEVKLEGEV